MDLSIANPRAMAHSRSNYSHVHALWTGWQEQMWLRIILQTPPDRVSGDHVLLSGISLNLTFFSTVTCKKIPTKTIQSWNFPPAKENDNETDFDEDMSEKRLAG